MVETEVGAAPDRRLIEVAFPQKEGTRLTLPGTVAPTDPATPTVGPVAAPPGTFVAEAELTVAALQDLADQIGEIKKATVDYDLRLRVRIELGSSPPPEVVTAVNTLLDDVSGDLKLH